MILTQEFILQLYLHLLKPRQASLFLFQWLFMKDEHLGSIWLDKMRNCVKKQLFYSSSSPAKRKNNNPNGNDTVKDTHIYLSFLLRFCVEKQLFSAVCLQKQLLKQIKRLCKVATTKDTTKSEQATAKKDEWVMQKFALKLSSFMGDLSKFLFIQDAKFLYTCA